MASYKEAVEAVYHEPEYYDIVYRGTTTEFSPVEAASPEDEDQTVLVCVYFKGTSGERRGVVGRAPTALREDVLSLPEEDFERAWREAVGL